MLEQSLRPIYEHLLVQPLVRWLGQRVAPLSITFLAGLLGVLFIPVLWFGYPLAAIGLLLASGYCDTLDGSLARFQNKTSSIGTALDIVIDRLVEFSAILGLYLLAPQSRALAVILMLGCVLLCITSFLVVGIFTPNQAEKGFHYSPGLMERAEAFGFFIAMILLPQHFNVLAMIFVILVSWTAFLRIKQFADAVK